MCFCWKRKTVEVSICEDSGLLAGAKCRKVAPKRYYVEPRPGDPEIPTTVCNLHAEPAPEPEPPAPNPEPEPGPPPVPVFPPKSKYPFWVFVPEMMFCSGDRRGFLRRMRMAGAWGVRVFLMQSWSTRNIYPYLQAVYGGVPVRLEVPAERWSANVKDMTAPNPAYYAELGKLLDELEEFDLGAIVSLEDNCSLRGGGNRAMKHEYPLMGSLQTMSKQENWPYLVPKAAAAICTPSPGGLHGKARYPWHRRWIDEVLSVVRSRLRVPVWVEIENEFSTFDWPDDSPIPRDWYAMMVEAVLAHDVPRSRIVHSGTKGTYGILRPHGGIYSQHAVVLPRPDISHIPKSDWHRVMLSGDGGFNGNSATDLDSFGKRGLSVADSIGLARFIKERGLIGYEWMPRIAWRKDDCLADVDRITDELPLAMIAEFNR